MAEHTSQIAMPVAQEVVSDYYVISQCYARSALVFAVCMASGVFVILALLITGIIPSQIHV